MDASRLADGKLFRRPQAGCESRTSIIRKAWPWGISKVASEGGGNSDGETESCDSGLFVEQSRPTKTFISKLAEETSLSRMGFSRDEPLDWTKSHCSEKTDLYRLLEVRITSYQDPDMLVKIGDREYRCHLLVLQCYSRYFEDKVKGRLEIAERDVTQSAFDSVYDWMLHKGPDAHRMMRRDNVLEIEAAARYLQVKDLEEQCWAFIDSEDVFNEDQAFLLYLQARDARNPTVMELMVPRVQRFFLTLVASQNFLEMSVYEVSVFLSSSYICVNSEMEVFMAVVRWLLFDWNARGKHAPKLMECVRFGLIEPKDLVALRRDRENREFRLATGDPLVLAMVEEGLAYATVKHWSPDEPGDYERSVDSLGLAPPVPRNWAGGSNGKCVIKKYDQFLNELDKYRRVITCTKRPGRELGDGRDPSASSSSEVGSVLNLPPVPKPSID